MIPDATAVSSLSTRLSSSGSHDSSVVSKKMMQALTTNLERYLSGLYKMPVRILSLRELHKDGARDLKQYGYGKPLLITLSAGDRTFSVVLETMSENSFGHDHFSDRAQGLLWEHECAARLPQHVRSVDVGAFTRDGELLSLGEAGEFFLVTEFVEGQEYQRDLERIRRHGDLASLDVLRAETLARYLARIHQTRNDAPHLYARRIRELLGHGECIMGLIDNYPAGDSIATPALLKRIEEQCLQWRWNLREMDHRLCQVHGDFHPWNILFREQTDFTVIDRSRGEWGEPADDVSSLAVNYLFEALLQQGSLSGPFFELYDSFWRTYLTYSNDLEMRKVIQPFFAFRALVLGNPTWYPHLPLVLRQKLFRFIETILGAEEFRFEEPHEYF